MGSSGAGGGGGSSDSFFLGMTMAPLSVLGPEVSWVWSGGWAEGGADVCAWAVGAWTAVSERARAASRANGKRRRRREEIIGLMRFIGGCVEFEGIDVIIF